MKTAMTTQADNRHNELEDLLDTLALLLAETLKGDALEKAECLTSNLEPPETPPKLSDLARLLADPDVRRGLHVTLQILKNIGKCTAGKEP